MKITKRTGGKERQILTGVIVHDQICGRLAAKWDKKEGLFESPWANLISSWCFKYHKKYNKAPRKSIEGLFQSWASDETKDKDTVRLVEKFLSGLSGEYSRLKKGINPEYVIDQAGEHFNEVKLRKLAQALEGDLDSGKLQEAIKRANSFRKLEVGHGAVVDVLHDKESWEQVYTDRPKSLIKFPDGLKQFYKNDLARECFVAFMGPMKRAKTYFQLDLAWRGMLQRNKVLFFQAGDLTKRQMFTRFASRAALRPIDAKTIEYPLDIEWADEEKMEVLVNHKKKKYKKSMSTKDSLNACAKIIDDRLKSDESFLRLSCHPPRTLSTDLMRSIIDDQVSQGFVPDIIVVDYADILARPPGFNGESRDAVNENWIQLARLRQELRCLVLTATQANAASFKAQMLDMSNFSEDNRKYAHVSGMIGLNQTNEEKDKQIWRLNWLVLREEAFLITRFCYCAGCLDIGNPAIRSIM